MTSYHGQVKRGMHHYEVLAGTFGTKAEPAPDDKQIV
jgi:hypothetical protein